MNRFIFAVVLLSVLMMLAGCSGKNTSAESSSYAVTEAVTENEAETTSAITPNATLTVTASQTTSPVQTTTVSPIFSNSIEIMNTELGSRPVPDNLRKNDYSGDIRKRAQSAIDEGRDMLGDCEAFCVDCDNNYLFICMYYGGDTVSAQIRNGYTFYRVNTDTGEIRELCNSDSVNLRNVFSMFCINGKLFVSTYAGFYWINEESGDITIIDAENEPAGGSGYVCNNKIYLISHSENKMPDTGNYNVYYRVYDPETGVLEELEECPDMEDKVFFYNYMCDKGKLIIEGESGKVQKFIFKWDLVSP